MRHLILLFFFIAFYGYSQVSKKTVYVKYIDKEIKIDGVLDEDLWSAVEPAKDFFQYFPTDSLQSQSANRNSFLV